MQPQELFQKALAQAERLSALPGDAAAEERLRDDAQAFFRRMPEPPAYRRAQDPQRDAAARLLPEAEGLLARAWARLKGSASGPEDTFLAQAVELHAEALCHTAGGRLTAAEKAWRRALAREQSFRDARRAWERTDKRERPVYDRSQRASRFDPLPAPTVRVRLACPNSACHTSGDFAFSPGVSTQRFTCPACRVPFLAFFGEVREGEVAPSGMRSKRYRFRVDEAPGLQARVEFEDTSGGDFHVSQGDLLAFLYTLERELVGVLNLSNSRLLWVRVPGACFIATVAFGEGAPELGAFRAFRDRVLLRTAWGRPLVAGYYAHGPALARALARWPWGRARARGALSLVHRGLVRWLPGTASRGPRRPRGRATA